MTTVAGQPLAPPLEPETADNVELNLHYTVSDSITTTLSVFYNQYENIIGWSGPTTEANSSWTAEQIEAISAAGVSEDVRE